MHPELRSSYAGRLADAYLLHEMKVRSCSDSIGHVQRLKERYSRDRDIHEIRIPLRERKEYFHAFRRLQTRVETVDRYIYDWFVLFPISILDHIIGIIETTRLQTKLLHWRSTRFILSRRTIKQFTVELMNAELAALSVKRFNLTIKTHFYGTQLDRFCVALKHGLRRYILNHCQFIHIDAKGDIELEMKELLDNTPRLQVSIRPAYPRRLSIRIDVHPAEPEPSPPPDSFTSSHALNERSPSAASSIPRSPPSVSSSTSDKQPLGTEKRRRVIHDDDASCGLKRTRMKLFASTSLHSEPITPTLSDSDSDSESDADICFADTESLSSSDDWSNCTILGDEMSDTGSSENTLTGVLGMPQKQLDLSGRRNASPEASATTPILQSWWTMVKDIFRIFR